MSTTSTKLGRVSIVPRGAYDSTTEYHWLDIVQYGGSSFLVLKENIIGVTPADGPDYMLVVEKGDQGPAGSSIQKIERTSGNGAPGTTDTYTITLTDGSTTTFQVYNGKDGTGSGDMSKNIYDPQNKATDIFKYVDDHTQEDAITVTGGGMVELAASLGLGPGPYKFIFTKAEE